jgi:hypothetical protein
VAGVERDKAAVVAGLTLPQNNGLVAGKVNKLKLLKRMGYGRAEFPRLASACPACSLEQPEDSSQARVRGWRSPAISQRNEWLKPITDMGEGMLEVT